MGLLPGGAAAAELHAAVPMFAPRLGETIAGLLRSLEARAKCYADGRVTDEMNDLRD